MEESSTRNNDQLFFRVLLFLSFAINVIGLFSPMLVDDPALFANIAKQMVVRSDFFNLYVHDTDWLDKPHFPFWCAAISMKIFGITGFAYKLPAFLFFLLGLFYTYKLASISYSKQIALAAVLILSSTFHIIIYNNDVRAEPYLIGLLLGASYHFYKTYLSYSFKNILLGSVLMACAIMTKGMFILVPVICGIIGHGIIKKEWKKIFHWQWIVAMVFISIFIIPEVYAVYVQFDLHPEKVVFGQTNVSGVKFFLWDSQFGRFFNTLPTIKGHSDPFFFLYNMFYTYAPWGVIIYVGFGILIRDMIRKKTWPEYFTFFAFVSTLILFSASKFQLPHYINILFPFSSILISAMVLRNQIPKWGRIVHFIYVIGLLVLVVCLYFFMKLELVWLFVLLTFVTIASLIVMVVRPIQQLVRFISISAVVGLFMGFFMNIFFYPEMINHETPLKIYKDLNNLPPDNKIAIAVNTELLDFLSNRPLIRLVGVNLDEVQLQSGLIIYADQKFLDELHKRQIKYKIQGVYLDMPNSKLNVKYFNPATRESTLKKRFLISL